MSAWHGNCYRQHPHDKFPILSVTDLDDEVFEDEDEDKNCFKTARDGDHLICRFQCHQCHFNNIQGQDPGSNPSDTMLLLCIRHANLDVFWARERGTVLGNVDQVARAFAICAVLGIKNPYPLRGPFPLYDSFGMTMACTLIIRSTDRGKNSNTIQFETMRKLRTHYANFTHTTPSGLSELVASGASNGSLFSGSPTNSNWFWRFMEGCHHRMGDQWYQDRAITIDEMDCLQALLEEDWTLYRSDQKNLLEIVLVGMCVVVGQVCRG